MRLWHIDLLPHLPKQWLMGQHRECCALRGKGWGRKHSTVDYVFTHPYFWLFTYHRRVIDNLEKLDVEVDPNWLFHAYRGKRIGYQHDAFTEWSPFDGYPEHDFDYLRECIFNLSQKGINITIGE